jgi:Tfp pilus assembly protein PilF
VLAGMAEAFEGENQGAKSIQLLQDELRGNPNLTALRGVLARIATTAGKFDIAIEQYQQLAASAPHSIDFLILLSGAYSAKGDAKSAEAVLEKAVQSDPKSVLASLLLARTLLATGRINEAKARYRMALQLQPNNASALNDLAYLMADSGENLDQALSYAQRGLQYAARDASLRTSLSDTLGWIYVKKNMNDTAVETYRPLVRDNPGNASYRYHFGTALYQKGDKQDARIELEAALADKPVATDAQKIRELLARL